MSVDHADAFYPQLLRQALAYDAGCFSSAGPCARVRRHFPTPTRSQTKKAPRFPYRAKQLHVKPLDAFYPHELDILLVFQGYRLLNLAWISRMIVTEKASMISAIGSEEGS